MRATTALAPPPPSGVFEAGVFGLRVRTEIELPGLRSADPRGAAPAVELLAASAGKVREAFSGGGDERVARVMQDDLALEARRGRSGDLLLEHGRRVCFHVSAAHDRVLCAPQDADDPRWKRLLLDTVLWLAALWHGREALHAAAVARTGGVIAIAAGTGGGKSTLSAELIARGATLHADDVLCFDQSGLTRPGPALMNLPASCEHLGTTIARIAGERWAELPRASAIPLPLRALVILERRHGLPTRLEPLIPRVTDLLPRLLKHPFAPGREHARLTLCARLASEVPTARLTASPEVPPARLAAMVEDFA